MRIVGVLLATCSLFLTAPVCAGNTASAALPASTDQLRGEDWLRFSTAQKERFVQIGIGGLERQGVFLTNPFSFYVQKMDAMLAAERSFLGQYLDNLFVFCVYDSEAQTREAIDRIRRENQAAAVGEA